MSEKRLEKIQQEIQEELLRELEQGVSFSDEQMQDEIEIRVLKRGQMEYLTIEEKMELVKKIFNSVRRLDVLQELLEDQDITEIMINGPDHIFIEKGGRLLDSGKKFPSQAKLEDVIQQIVSKVNRVVNEASPIVDVRLLDGSRVNVVLPPVALDGPVMTIRRFPENPFDMDKLLELGSITKEAAVFLRTLVEARYNIFISGGTGSGKTTFLNALSNYIPSTERIVTIEDSAELQIQNIANLVRLETRNANLEGKNEITVRDLVRSALRQRPDRIIIGEIRDAAVIELLSAMNTGHDEVYQPVMRTVRSICCAGWRRLCLQEWIFRCRQCVVRSHRRLRSWCSLADCAISQERSWRLMRYAALRMARLYCVLCISFKRRRAAVRSM